MEATIMELYRVLFRYIGLGFRVYSNEGLRLFGSSSIGV